ncbi:MAG: DUF2157 domain-containing protein [Planctomyces sp.]
MPPKKLSPHQRSWLINELQQWEAAGLLQPGQGPAILGNYQSAENASADTTSKIISALMSTAAALVVAGVLLLISFNWGELSAAIKLTLIFGVITATYFAAFRMRRLGRLPLSNTLFFLGASFYGCGIMLISQMFHISGHAPDAFWWWAIGTLPLAVMLESALLHGLLAALLAIWSSMEILGGFAAAATSWWSVRFISATALTLPLFVVPGFLLAIRTSTPRLLWIYVPLLTFWLTMQPIAWCELLNVQSAHVLFLTCATGGLLLMIAQSYQPRNAMSLPWRTCGVITTGSSLLPLSFYGLHGYEAGAFIHSTGLLWQAISILVLTFCVFAAAFRWSADDLPGFFHRQRLPVTLNLLMALMAGWDSLTADALLPTVLTNMVMLSFGVWLLLLGVREERGRPFAVGVLYVLLWTIIRYVDLFGSIGGMLGASAMFFAAGGILFTSAWYWKNQRSEVKS